MTVDKADDSLAQTLDRTCAVQLRGDSTCQVKDVELSLAVGGPGYAPGSAVLFGPAL